MMILFIIHQVLSSISVYSGVRVTKMTSHQSNRFIYQREDNSKLLGEAKVHICEAAVVDDVKIYDLGIQCFWIQY